MVNYSHASVPCLWWSQVFERLLVRQTLEHIDSWGTLLVSGLQLGFIPLITILLAHLFSQFSIYHTVYSFSPYINSFSMRKLWETVESLTEVELDNCPSFVYQASHFITQFYRVGEA